jgi:hypothetical protein
MRRALPSLRAAMPRRNLDGRLARLERAVPIPEPANRDAQRALYQALVEHDPGLLRELRDLTRLAMARGFASNSRQDPEHGCRIREIYQLADELVAGTLLRKIK